MKTPLLLMLTFALLAAPSTFAKVSKAKTNTKREVAGLREITFWPTRDLGESGLCPDNISLILKDEKIENVIRPEKDLGAVIQYSKNRRAVAIMNSYDDDIVVRLINFVFTPAGEPLRINYRDVSASDTSTCSQIDYVQRL